MKIAVVGFGVEGRAIAQYFEKKGEDITICDERKQNIGKNIKGQFGPNYLEGLVDFDLVFRSPGIPFLKKEFMGIRKKLTSLTKYFFEKCPCKIIGVTGTKGKGTTASLIYEMLKSSYKNGKVFLGGNIGTPPLAFLYQLKPKDLVILELSSFQLQDLDRSPHIAVVLGITPDHLDHHKTFEEYVEAKKNIVKFQTSSDMAILDADNEYSNSFARATKAKVLYFSMQQAVPEGAFLKVGSFILKDGKTGTMFGEKGATGLIGNHNIKNIFAAAATASVLNMPVETITKIVREFKGLPHRLEFVKEIDSVRYYNDSASTNPDTAIAAIQAFHTPIILIAGGSDKNADYANLGEEIAKRLNVKTVVIMGQTKAKLEKAIENACTQEEKKNTETTVRTGRPVRSREIPLELISAETYQEAFMVAKLVAQPGDTVLLSPACASFDMFANYQERGEIFRNFVTDS